MNDVTRDDILQLCEAATDALQSMQGEVQPFDELLRRLKWKMFTTRMPLAVRWMSIALRVQKSLDNSAQQMSTLVAGDAECRAAIQACLQQLGRHASALSAIEAVFDAKTTVLAMLGPVLLEKSVADVSNELAAWFTDLQPKPSRSKAGKATKIVGKPRRSARLSKK